MRKRVNRKAYKNIQVHCVIIVINLLLLWAFQINSILNGSDRQKRISIVEQLQAEQKKGKRNTYCDHLRHLVREHGYGVDLLVECEELLETDLEITLKLEGI